MTERTTRREFLSTTAALAGAAMLPGCESTRRMGRAPGRRPNIVFVFDDQLRAAAVGCYGGVNVPTPNLDRIAGQGVRFTNALSTCPVCTPYRGMVMTGRWPTHTGIVLNWVDSNPAEYCIAEAFRDSGYDTGFIGKWHLAAGARKHDGKFSMTKADEERIRTGRRAFLADNPEPEFVPPGPQRQGFDYWAAYNFHANFAQAFYYRDTPERLIMPTYETDSEVDLAIDFMKQHEGSETPFFITIAPHPPHPPWSERQTPAGCVERVRNPIQYSPNVPTPHPDRLEAAKYYYGMIANFDDNMGRLVDYLDRSGLSEDTILVISADHGEMLGSHGRFNKMVPYEEAVHIPLLFRAPGRIAAGRTSDALYAPIDHMPTLCELAGVTVPSSADGMSLAGAAQGGRQRGRDAALMMNYTSHWDFFDTGTNWPEWRGVRTHTHTYARWLTGQEELYDNVADPHQMNNLAEGQRDLPRLLAMRRELADQLAEAHDEFLPGTAYADWYDDARNLVRTALGPAKR